MLMMIFILFKHVSPHTSRLASNTISWLVGSVGDVVIDADIKCW